MEVDNTTLGPRTTVETNEELQESQYMEEEPESIDIGELDILGYNMHVKQGALTKSQIDK